DGAGLKAEVSRAPAPAVAHRCLVAPTPRNARQGGCLAPIPAICLRNRRDRSALEGEADRVSGAASGRLRGSNEHRGGAHSALPGSLGERRRTAPTVWIQCASAGAREPWPTGLLGDAPGARSDARGGYAARRSSPIPSSKRPMRSRLIVGYVAIPSSKRPMRSRLIVGYVAIPSSKRPMRSRLIVGY